MAPLGPVRKAVWLDSKRWTGVWCGWIVRGGQGCGVAA